MWGGVNLVQYVWLQTEFAKIWYRFLCININDQRVINIERVIDLNHVHFCVRYCNFLQILTKPIPNKSILLRVDAPALFKRGGASKVGLKFFLILTELKFAEVLRDVRMVLTRNTHTGSVTDVPRF